MPKRVLSDIDRAIVPPRPISAAERAILDFLLEEPFLGRDEIREQLRTAKVDVECTCGCLTVEFEIDPSTPPIPEHRKLVVPVEADGEDSDGLYHLFLLFTGRRDDLVWMLEHVHYADEGVVVSFPPVSVLKRTINEVSE